MSAVSLVAILTLFGVFDIGEDSHLTSSGIAPGETAFFGNYTFKRFVNESTLNSNKSSSESELLEISGEARVSLTVSRTDIGSLGTSRGILHLSAGFLSSEIVLRSGLNIESNSTSSRMVFAGSTDPGRFALISKVTPCDLGLVIVNINDGSMSTVMGSEGCYFSLSLTTKVVDINRSNAKVSVFTYVTNMMTFFQCRAIWKLLESFDLNNQASRVSLMCILWQNLGDVVEAVSFTLLGLQGQFMFSSLALTGLMKFFLFAILQARLVIAVWRSKQPAAEVETSEQVRVGVQRLYGKFNYVTISVFVLLLFAFDHLKTIVLVYQLYWLPQIVHDVYRGQKSSLTIRFVLTMALTRLWVPFYLWSSGSSLFDGKLYAHIPGSQSVSFVFILLCLQVFQLLIMTSQRIRGPRWFVPWVLLPHVYNYYRSVPVDEEAGVTNECVICMAEISKEMLSADRTAVTPCAHVFHAKCLEQWLEIKMECPTCRRSLPPIT